MTVVLFSSSYCIKQMAEMVTGEKIGDGVSPWAFVSMGLQANEDRFDGWYSDYVGETYKESKYNKAKQAAIAKKDIKQRLVYFKNHPFDALIFFAGKNLSQWNNPDFMSFRVNQQLKKPQSSYPKWTNYLLSFHGNRQIDVFLDIYLFIV